jgi:D-alanine transaminase
LSRVIFVNGQYCDYNKSNIHVEDRGYQFADGVYEVFTVINSSVVDYAQHLDRLYKSLSELKIKSPISKKTYIFHIRNIIRKNMINNGTVYLQVTRGVEPRDFKYSKNIKSTITIIGKIIPENKFNYNIQNGINIVTTKDLRWKRCDIKSINLLPPVLAKQFAHENNAIEAWLLDDDDFVTEGSSSTAWILDKNNCLKTASLMNNILPGITRETFLTGLKKNKIKFKEASFNLRDIKSAKEAFISSATTFVTPVNKVNNIKIGNGKPGKFAPIFLDIYKKAIKLQS